MSNSNALSLVDYVHMVWRRKMLVALIAAGMAGSAVGVSLLTPPTYAAVSEMVLAQQQLDSNFNLATEELSARQMDTQIAMIKSDAVATRARSKGAVGEMEASSASESNLVKIQVLDSDPRRAADSANAYVDAYMEISAEGTRKTLDDAAEQLKQRMTLLQQQIDPLVAQVRGASASSRASTQTTVGALLSGLQQQQASLQAQLGRIEVQRALSGSAVVVQRAVPPTVPEGPKPLQDGALAAILGLAIGISLSVLLELRRRGSAAAARAADHAEPPAGGAPPAPVTSGAARGEQSTAPTLRPAEPAARTAYRSAPPSFAGPPHPAAGTASRRLADGNGLGAERR